MDAIFRKPELVRLYEGGFRKTLSMVVRLATVATQARLD
jgi:hypothetical protein